MKRSARPVIITRPDGTEVEYQSQSAAARAEPLIQQSLISEMCRGKRASLHGYKARWAQVITPGSSAAVASVALHDSTTGADSISPC
jgi:hypothetical protein